MNKYIDKKNKIDKNEPISSTSLLVQFSFSHQDYFKNTIASTKSDNLRNRLIDKQNETHL